MYWTFGGKGAEPNDKSPSLKGVGLFLRPKRLASF
jgi:hypothetical protein